MTNLSHSKIQQLLNKGVSIPNPETITIGDEIDIERISGTGTVFHSGTKVFGKSTLIQNNVELGYEAPVTVENCQLGPEVKLNGGFFKQAVFLKKASMGSGSHVRQGTIFEEEANAAHTVGLKQTILFPFVTLGSLINFCDCFMSGGTSRKDHSEVGSSYIHFNYTPEQDKATPSILGDVPNGVMLNESPIFLGGQGGLVGPTRLTFGTITAAGSIIRKDELRKGRLLMEGGKREINITFPKGAYRNVKRNIQNNIIYIANLHALRMWYRHVRSMFISSDFSEDLFVSLKHNLDIGIDERMKRLKDLSQKIHARAGSDHIDSELFLKWDNFEQLFENLQKQEGDNEQRDTFLQVIDNGIKTNGKDYIPVIKGLDIEDAEMGTIWLQGIVDHILDESINLFSALG